MMQFQSLMSDFEIIKPGRQLIKDGPLEKVCRKSTRERYFILVSSKYAQGDGNVGTMSRCEIRECKLAYHLMRLNFFSNFHSL